MFRFAPYVLKTLWRHRSRTFLTVSGVAVALFVFCFVESIQEGMHNLHQQKEMQQSLIVFQANKFCPATSQLPQDYEQELAQLDGIREVVPISVFTNNCRASLDVVVFYGLPAEQLRRVRNFELSSGSWAEFEQHQDAAMIGQAVAQRKRLHVGDKFSLGELTVTVAGIYTSDNHAEENYAYTHLDFLQRTANRSQVGRVTQFEVLLEENQDAHTKCNEIDALFRSSSVETTTRSKGAFQARSLGDLQELIGLLHYLGYACLGLMLVLVATTTIMSVEDRVKEHAVLQSIGFSPFRVFAVVFQECLILSFVGGLLGVAGALALLSFSNLAVGAEGVTIPFRPSLRMAWLGTLFALLTGTVAGLAPAWKAARADIVSALRQG